MSKSPVETLEKVVGHRLIMTCGLTLLRQPERHVEFNASKIDNA